VPKFNKGETLTASKLNKIVDAVNILEKEQRANRIHVGAGFTMMRSSSGTTLALNRANVRGETVQSVESASHPFKVTTTLSDGVVSIYMKGGCWHGNGSGNYLGISYLETPPDEIADIPEAIGEGEDLFVIPDCEAELEVASGGMFAVCLYSPATDGGRLKTYPWAYVKKIESAEKLRSELIAYAYSAVAIVGIWKLTSDSEGAQKIRGTPGQMLQSDFFYKNNQIFSTGKFGWSRIDGIKNGFRASEGLLYVKPNAISSACCTGDVLSLQKGEKTETEIEASGLKVSIPRLTFGIETETETEEHVIVKKFEETDNGCEVVKTIAVQVPTYSANTTTKSISFVSGLTAETEAYTRTFSVPKYAFKSEKLTATPTSETAWTRVLLIGPVTTSTTTQSLQLYAQNYSPATSSATVVSSVALNETGTKTSTATVTVSGKKYICETEKTEISRIKGISANVGECEKIEYAVSGSLPINGADLSATTCTDQEKIKKILGISIDGDAEQPDLMPFFISVPGRDFQLSDEELESGIIVALHVVCSSESVSVEWKKISLTAEFNSSPAKIPSALAEMPQVLSLAVGLVIGTDDGCENTASETLVGLRASVEPEKMKSFSTTIPVAVLFREPQTKVPIAQPLKTGCIEVLHWHHVATTIFKNAPQKSLPHHESRTCEINKHLLIALSISAPHAKPLCKIAKKNLAKKNISTHSLSPILTSLISPQKSFF